MWQRCFKYDQCVKSGYKVEKSRRKCDSGGESEGDGDSIKKMNRSKSSTIRNQRRSMIELGKERDKHKLPNKEKKKRKNNKYIKSVKRKEKKKRNWESRVNYIFDVVNKIKNMKRKSSTKEKRRQKLERRREKERWKIGNPYAVLRNKKNESREEEKIEKKKY